MEQKWVRELKIFIKIVISRQPELAVLLLKLNLIVAVALLKQLRARSDMESRRDPFGTHNPAWRDPLGAHNMEHVTWNIKHGIPLGGTPSGHEIYEIQK